MRLDKVWYEVIMSCDKVSNFRHKYCNTKMTLNLLPSEQLMEVFAVCWQKKSELRVEKYVEFNFECNCGNAMLSNPVV